VCHGAGRQAVLQVSGEGVDHDGGPQPGSEKRDSGINGFLLQCLRHLQPFGDDETANTVTANHGGDPGSFRFGTFLQEPDFRFTQDLYPSRVDILQESGQGQTRFLNPRALDQVVQPGFSDHQFQGEILRVFIGQQFAHRHGRDGAAFMLAHCLSPCPWKQTPFGPNFADSTR